MPYPGPVPAGIPIMAQMAGTDVVCGVSATTGESRWWADPEEKAVRCDGFLAPWSIVSLLPPPHLNSDNSRARPTLSLMQSHLKGSLISEKVLFSREKQR